ncbi:ABC transporter permease [Celeribacter sp.]|uniref:ABC transporter permease n=1 Tax=Celeribacter sp. TaxID=1890673 RepID=UPI003A928CB0
MSFELFKNALPVILDGLYLTVVITLLAFALGQFVALPLALLANARSRWLSSPMRTYIFCIRGSPLLVQLFIIYYGFGSLELVRSSLLWPILREPLYCAILAVGLNSAAYVAELLRGTIRQFPVGQSEAAKALGMSGWQAMRHITLPQVYRSVLPVLGNEIVLVMKASSLASAVTVVEMTGAARAFVARTYAPFEVFAAAGCFYLIFGLVLAMTFKALERQVAVPGLHR